MFSRGVICNSVSLLLRSSQGLCESRLVGLRCSHWLMAISTGMREECSSLLQFFDDLGCDEVDDRNSKGRDVCRGLSGWGGEDWLARAPVGVGTCADADEGWGEDGESENGCENCGVHTCSLVSAIGACSLHEGFVSVCHQCGRV